jgi:hypothetical protein
MTPRLKSLFIVALALTLIAPSLSALAQQALEQPRTQILHHPPKRESGHLRSTQFSHTLATLPKLDRHSYLGSLDWQHGRWRHEKHSGRYGWWWDAGAVWYFYPEETEGPPAYVSNIEIAAEATGAPEPPQEPHRVIYYPPGDLKGVAYKTIEECNNAAKQAGNVGICVLK